LAASLQLDWAPSSFPIGLISHTQPSLSLWSSSTPQLRANLKKMPERKPTG
jgi:hypothetical protein